MAFQRDQYGKTILHDGEPIAQILLQGRVRDARENTLDQIRKLISALEFELMSDEPDNIALRRHAQSAITLLKLEFVGDRL